MIHSVTGRIHSIETMSAVDGPGVRVVVFLQGCPFRCLFCHNPDSWVADGGEEYTVSRLTDTIMRYRNYIVHGGVTFSGGEPLLQSEFVAQVASKCRDNGIHVAVDTSGLFPPERAMDALHAADMLLLDVKSIDSALCRDLTGGDAGNTTRTLKLCEEHGKPVWVRHVVLPEYDTPDEIGKIARYVSRFKCVERLQLLPYHKLGEHKWLSLGLTPAPLTPPSDELMQAMIMEGRKFFSHVD